MSALSKSRLKVVASEPAPRTPPAVTTSREVASVALPDAEKRARQISAWIWRLSGLMKFPAGDVRDRAQKLADYADGLAMADMPLEAFSKRALFDLAERYEWFPSFKEVKEGVTSHWKAVQNKATEISLPDWGPRYHALSIGDRSNLDSFRRSEAQGWLHDGETEITDREKERRRGLRYRFIESHHPQAFWILESMTKRESSELEHSA